MNMQTKYTKLINSLTNEELYSGVFVLNSQILEKFVDTINETMDRVLAIEISGSTEPDMDDDGLDILAHEFAYINPNDMDKIDKFVKGIACHSIDHHIKIWIENGYVYSFNQGEFDSYGIMPDLGSYATGEMELRKECLKNLLNTKKSYRLKSED